MSHFSLLFMQPFTLLHHSSKLSLQLHWHHCSLSQPPLSPRHVQWQLFFSPSSTLVPIQCILQSADTVMFLKHERNNPVHNSNALSPVF